AGLTIRQPAPGFEVTSIALRAEGECDETGNASEGEVVIDYQWRHTATGITASVTQRAENEPIANVKYPSSATFTAGGEVFAVDIWNYWPMPVDRVGGSDV